MRIAVIPWYRTWLNIHAIAARYSIESEKKLPLNREEGEGRRKRKKNKERKKLKKVVKKGEKKKEKEEKRAKKDKKTR